MTKKIHQVTNDVSKSSLAEGRWVLSLCLKEKLNLHASGPLNNLLDKTHGEKTVGMF